MRGLVGAKTVNGPLLLSVSTSEAAFTAATNVEKSLLSEATVTMVTLAGAAVVSVVDEAPSLSLPQHHDGQRKCCRESCSRKLG